MYKIKKKLQWCSYSDSRQYYFKQVENCDIDSSLDMFSQWYWFSSKPLSRQAAWYVCFTSLSSDEQISAPISNFCTAYGYDIMDTNFRLSGCRLKRLRIFLSTCRSSPIGSDFGLFFLFLVTYSNNTGSSSFTLSSATTVLIFTRLHFPK